MLFNKSAPERTFADDAALLALLTISQLFVEARARIASEPTDGIEAMARELEDAEVFVEAALAANETGGDVDAHFARTADADAGPTVRLEPESVVPARPETETTLPSTKSARASRSLGRLKRLDDLTRTKRDAVTTRTSGAIMRGHQAVARGQDVLAAAQDRVTTARVQVAERVATTHHPGSPAWNELSDRERILWWYRRFAPAAALVASTPALAGRVGVKTQVGEVLAAASEAVLISAIGWETGVHDPVRHVQVSARLLLRREVTEDELTVLVDRAKTRVQSLRKEPLAEAPSRLASARLIWQSAQQLRDIESTFSHRPRGNPLARAVKNVPTAGAIAAFVAELGGLRKTLKLASREFGLTQSRS